MTKDQLTGMKNLDRKERQRLVAGYRAILESIVESPKAFAGKELIAFGGMAGTGEEVDVMYIGRATNGGQWTFNTGQLAGELDEIAVKAMSYEPKEANSGDPLSWVESCWRDEEGNYNTARSQFWQTIRGISTKRQAGLWAGETGNWWDNIVWTNLLKVAPERGNPSITMTKVMGEACLEMILTEIAVYQPKNIVCLSGLSWAANLLSRAEKTRRVEGSYHYVEYVGNVEFKEGVMSRLVIAPHPQSRSSQRISDEIVECLLR